MLRGTLPPVLLLNEYPLPPGCCFRCYGNSLPVIDLLLDDDALGLAVDVPVERQGSLYLCVDCVSTMAGMYGFISPEGATALNERQNVVIARAEAAEAEVRELAAIVEGYERADERRSRQQEATSP